MVDDVKGRGAAELARSAAPLPLQGVDGLIRTISQYASEALADETTNGRIIRRLGDEFAYIRLEDISNPLRFLHQMAGAPPVQIGTEGFNPSLVDDHHPARHYMAFVWLGYWLPRWVAIVILWLWEIAGFIRYRGSWSAGDIRSGQIGIQHATLVKQYGVVVLPSLVASDVADRREVQTELADKS